MRTFLLAALAVSSASLLTACPLAPGCGGFEGEGDVAYQRGTDTAFVCANGGFTGSLEGRTIEGRYQAGNVIDGATGAFLFDFAMTGDAAASTQMGAGWERVELDEVALDHAHVLCEDLTLKPWFTATTALPVATAFAKVAEGFDSPAACELARSEGNWPANYACEDRLVLCPNGTLQLATNDASTIAGTYSADGGTLGIATETWGFTGVYSADGTLATLGLNSDSKVTWRTTTIEGRPGACQ